jgi:hypothetical protein
MAPGAPQEDVLGGGEAAHDEAPQSPQERGEVRQREEDGGVEEADEEEEAPSHLPFAPSSEVRGPLPLVYCSRPSPTAMVVSTLPWPLGSPRHWHSVEQLVTFVWPSVMDDFLLAKVLERSVWLAFPVLC